MNLNTQFAFDPLKSPWNSTRGVTTKPLPISHAPYLCHAKTKPFLSRGICLFMLTPCVTSLSKRAYQYSSQKKDRSSSSSLIEKKKKKKELVVLGGQYVVVAVSWLSEKNIYIHREEMRRDVKGDCPQKEKMKKMQHANSKLKMRS